MDDKRPTRRLSTPEILRVSRWIDENKTRIVAHNLTYTDAAKIAGDELRIDGLNATHVSTVAQADPSGFTWPHAKPVPDAAQADTLDKLRRGMAAIANHEPLPADVAEWLGLVDATRPLLHA